MKGDNYADSKSTVPLFPESRLLHQQAGYEVLQFLSFSHTHRDGNRREANYDETQCLHIFQSESAPWILFYGRYHDELDPRLHGN